MKKIVCMLLALLLVLSMTACGGEKEIEIQTPNGASGQASSGNQGSSVKPKDVTIEETVLYDDNGVKITAKKLDFSGYMGPELKLTVENNSGMNLTIQDRNTAINGYKVDTIMSIDVANGKKANDSITFMDSSLELCGIDAIAVMEFSFTMFEEETWEDYLTTETITLTTSISDGAVMSAEHTGQLAYEENGVKIVIKGLTSDASYMGDSIVVYIENNSDENIMVQANDVSDNGFMVDPIFSCEIPSGKRAVDTMTFMSSELEENEITTISNIELSFNIFNADTWQDIADSDVVTIDFQ